MDLVLSRDADLALNDYYIDSLIDSLASAEKRVKDLKVDITLFEEGDVSAEKHNEFCNAIANVAVQGLRRLTFQGKDDVVDVRCMTRIILGATGLKKLSFECIIFDGTTQEHQAFCSALSNYCGLTHLVMYECTTADCLLGHLNPFLALSCSLAKDTRLVYQYVLAEWIGEADWNPSEESADLFLPVAQAMKATKETVVTRNTKLVCSVVQYHGICPRNLELKVKLTREDLQRVALIVRNSNGLKKLYVDASGVLAEEGHVSPLLEALQTNTALRCFSFCFREYKYYDFDGLMFLPALIRPGWRTTTVSEGLLESFSNLIEPESKMIATIKLFSGPHQRPLVLTPRIQERIKHNTKMNRFGRSRLKKDPHIFDQEEWIRCLHRSRNDVGCLFAFLSMNPLLCSHYRKPRVLMGRRGVITRARKRRQEAVLVEEGEVGSPTHSRRKASAAS